MTKLVSWYPVKDNDSKLIGAIGFLGNEAVAAVSFHSKMDANRDGKVSNWEWLAYKLSPISLSLCGTAEVIHHANAQLMMDLGNRVSQMRAASVSRMRAETMTKMGQGAIIDAIYKTYFGRALGTLVGMGTKLRYGLIKELVIRQAVSKQVKKAFDHAIKNPMLAE